MNRRNILKNLGAFLGAAALYPAQKVIASQVPSIKETFVLATRIAGTSYVDEIDSIARNLEIGEILSVVRELKNEYDNLAVKILNNKNQKLGYIPMDEREVIARLLDAGYDFKIKVSNIEKINYWNKISIDILMVS